MKRNSTLSVVCDLLYCLGVTPNYTGFDLTAHAVLLCIQRPERLKMVTKWLYPDVAKAYGTTGAAVERNIRTVSCVAWQENRPLLEALARRRLVQPPRNTQFLSTLVVGLLHTAPSSATALLPQHGLGETVALPREDQNVGVVDEAVDEGGGEAVIPKDGIPLAEFQI